MARGTSVNYAGALAFTYATTGPDAFKKEDVQGLAQAVELHTHDGAGKGLGVAGMAIKTAIDMPDWYRSTGHTSAFPVTGQGIEMYYDTAVPAGVLQSYNRGASTLQPLQVKGSAISFTVATGSVSLSLSADNSAVFGGALTCNSDFSVGGQSHLTGTVVCNAIQCSGIAASAAVTVGGSLTVTGVTALNSTVNVSGNITTPNAVQAGQFTLGSGGQYIFPVAGVSIRYAVAAGGTHSFEVVGGGTAPVACGSINITGTVVASGALSASQVTVPNSFIGNGCVINNGTNNQGVYLYVNGPAGGTSGWSIIPSSIRFKTQVAAITQALALVMDDTLHGMHYLVSPENTEPFEAFGFIAEDWYERAPEIVHLLDGAPQGMDYGQIIAIVFEALKQYIARTDTRLSALEGNPV